MDFDALLSAASRNSTSAQSAASSLEGSRRAKETQLLRHTLSKCKRPAKASAAAAAAVDTAAVRNVARRAEPAFKIPKVSAPADAAGGSKDESGPSDVAVAKFLAKRAKGKQVQEKERVKTKEELLVKRVRDHDEKVTIRLSRAMNMEPRDILVEYHRLTGRCACGPDGKRYERPPPCNVDPHGHGAKAHGADKSRASMGNKAPPPSKPQQQPRAAEAARQRGTANFLSAVVRAQGDMLPAAAKRETSLKTSSKEASTSAAAGGKRPTASKAKPAGVDFATLMKVAQKNGGKRTLADLEKEEVQAEERIRREDAERRRADHERIVQKRKEELGMSAHINLNRVRQGSSVAKLRANDSKLASKSTPGKQPQAVVKADSKKPQTAVKAAPDRGKPAAYHKPSRSVDRERPTDSAQRASSSKQGPSHKKTDDLDAKVDAARKSLGMKHLTPEMLDMFKKLYKEQTKNGGGAKAPATAPPRREKEREVPPKRPKPAVRRSPPPPRAPAAARRSGGEQWRRNLYMQRAGYRPPSNSEQRDDCDDYDSEDDEYDEDMADFIDDSQDADDALREEERELKQTLRQVFGYDSSKFKNERAVDDRSMEVRSFGAIASEEARSQRIARLEEAAEEASGRVRNLA